MAGICHIGKGRCKLSTGVIVYFCNCASRMFYCVAFFFLVQRKSFVFPHKFLLYPHSYEWEGFLC